MTSPAPDRPNHVTAYPAWVAGVTLNSPTVLASGLAGYVRGLLGSWETSMGLVSVKRGGERPSVPVPDSSAARSNQRSLLGSGCRGERNRGSVGSRGDSAQRVNAEEMLSSKLVFAGNRNRHGRLHHSNIGLTLCFRWDAHNFNCPNWPVPTPLLLHKTERHPSPVDQNCLPLSCAACPG